MFTNFKHLVLVSLFVQALAGCGTETFGACESIDGGQSADTSCFKRLFENKEKASLGADMTLPPVNPDMKPAFAGINIPIEVVPATFFCGDIFQITQSGDKFQIKINEIQARSELLDAEKYTDGTKYFCRMPFYPVRHSEAICSGLIRVSNQGFPEAEVAEFLRLNSNGEFKLKIELNQKQLSLSPWNSAATVGSSDINSEIVSAVFVIPKKGTINDIKNFTWRVTEKLVCDGPNEAPSFPKQGPTPYLSISSLRLE